VNTPADVVLVLERELLEGPAERGQLRAHHVHAAPLLHLARHVGLQGSGLRDQGVGYTG